MKIKMKRVKHLLLAPLTICIIMCIVLNTMAETTGGSWIWIYLYSAVFTPL